MTAKRLPDDPMYWENLAQRIEGRAWEQRERGGAAVLDWLASRVPLMAAAALAAAAALPLAVRATPIPDKQSGDATAEWTAAFAPHETLGRQLSAARPPTLGQLIAGESLVTPRRRSLP